MTSPYAYVEWKVQLYVMNNNDSIMEEFYLVILSWSYIEIYWNNKLEKCCNAWLLQYYSENEYSSPFYTECSYVR